MMLRALFWVAVVAVLMPHGPNLGLSKSSAQSVVSLPATLASWTGNAVNAPQRACADHATSCAEALGFLDTLQTAAVRSLAQVKVEIEASQRARAQRLAYND